MTEQSISLNTHPQEKKPDYKKYDQRVRDICRSMARSFSKSGNLMVDDYIQIACIKVWQSFEKYDASMQFEPFVKAIARNAFIDINKSPQNLYLLTFNEAYQESAKDTGSQVKEFFSDDDANDFFFNPSDSMESCFSDVDIEALLSVLSERERQVIMKTYGINCLYEMNDARIAEDLKVTRQTVITYRKEGMRKLKNRIGQ